MLAVIGLALLGAAPASAATWSPQETLLPGKRVEGPLVGVGSGGSAVALWAVVPPPKLTFSSPGTLAMLARRRGSGYSIQYAARSAAGQPFGPAVTLQQGLPKRVGFGVAEDGRAVVARLLRNRRLVVNRIDPQGVLGPTEQIAGRVRNLQLSVAEDGTTVLLYEKPGHRFVAQATAAADGAFGPPELVGRIRGGTWQTALDAGIGGRAVVAWEPKRGQVLAAQRSEGAFTPIERVPKARYTNNSVEVAAAPTESLVFLNGLYDLPRVRVAVAPAGGRFAPAEEIPTSGPAQGEFGLIDVDSAGNATAAWTRYRAGGRADGIELATRPAGGEFKSRPLVRGPYFGVESLDVAADGAAVITFDKLRGRDLQIGAALRSAGGQFGPPQRVGMVESRASVIFSASAIASGGHAVVGWSDPVEHRLSSLGVFVSSAEAP